VRVLTGEDQQRREAAVAQRQCERRELDRFRPSADNDRQL
jgi:hypothetical protein